MSAVVRRCVLVGWLLVAAAGCGDSPSGPRAPASVERSLHWLVEYTYYFEDAADERRLITIRQLAREHLQSLKDQDGNCEPALQRQLEAVTH